MKFHKALGAILITLLCSQAQADGTIMGNGARSCGSYNEAAGKFAVKVQFDAWAIGYLSGMNYMTSGTDVLSSAEAEGIIGALQLYCQQHPLDSFLKATVDVYGQLLGRSFSQAVSKKK